MARIPESKELARVIRSHARESVKKNGQRFTKGIVKTVSPLAVVPATSEIVVTSGFLLLGSWPRLYDLMFGIQVGDTLLMTRLEDGDWFVFDVVSQNDLVSGVDPDPGAYVARSVTTANGNVVGLVPYNDATGAEIGVLLVFDRSSLH